MRCIFCKQDSNNSVTVEHIIPESLGNKDHILAKGIVCDACNSYFARKIEGPLLDSDYFRQLRFRNMIKNKKNRIPTIEGVLLPGMIPLEMVKDEEGNSVLSHRERDSNRFIQILKTIKAGKLIFPISLKPHEYLMSRFLAKIALETLVFRTMNVPGSLEEIVEKKEFNQLRIFARFGQSVSKWPFNSRIIYPENNVFNDGIEKFQILHEFDLLYTESRELYLVVAILGTEYVINLGGPEIEGYTNWLKQNNFTSPLYKK